MINLTIDGKAIAVPKGTTVYAASQLLGIDIPIFCYLDRMPPFGACRMCLVEVEKMPKLQASCTLEATEGMVVSTVSDKAVDGRKGILELLLINHPLDCPICDKGGECPLQDQTLEHGPGKSRFTEDKRRLAKALPLTPVLTLDRERCIICARCTRFSELISGDHALEMSDRGYKTEIIGNPESSKPSKFIGNTIKICPVGALTSQAYRFQARPWDNSQIATTCTLCPVGCNMTLDERDGNIMRTRSRENGDINDIWLCDKGWFGYEFVDSPQRLLHPLIRNDAGKLVETSWDHALGVIADKIMSTKASGKLAAFGGDPLTVEESYLLQKFMRQYCGTNHLDHRIGLPLFSLYDEGLMAGMESSIGACEKLDYAILFGIDLTEEFPVIWLRLKQAINRGAKVIFIGHYAPEIASQIAATILHAPGCEVEFIQKHGSKFIGDMAPEAIGALFVGKQYLCSPSRRHILSQLLQLRCHRKSLALHIMEGRGNSMGARIAGMHPEMGPLGAAISPSGFNALQVLQAAAEGGWSLLYVVGADPAAQMPHKLWRDARQKLELLVVQDLFLTGTAEQADIVLPSLSFLEKAGHCINIEGRVQKLLPGKLLPQGVYSDGQILQMLAEKLHGSLEMDRDFVDKLKLQETGSASMPPLPLCRPQSLEGSYASEAPKEGLRTSFAPYLFDEGIRMRHNPHLAELAIQPYVRLHPHDGGKKGVKEGDIVTIASQDGSLQAVIALDPLVAEGTLVLPLGFKKIPVHDLSANLFNGLPVTITIGG